MQISCVSDAKFLDLVIVPFWEGEKKAEIAWGKKDALAFLASISFKEFLGKKGESLLLYENEKRFLLLGLGKESEVSLDHLRFAYGEAMQLCLKKKVEEVSCVLPESSKFLREFLVFSIAEALALANYAFDKYKKEKQILVKKVLFLFSDPEEEKILDKVHFLQEGIFFARDLINENADIVTPQKLAEVAKNLAKEHSALQVKIFDKKEIKKMNMGLFLAVNQGSEKEPVFIEISYRNNPSAKEHVALVGKGITYDTGGLCLKPPSGPGGMDTMRHDMSGAAAVLAILKILAHLNVKINVTGIIAATENAISSTSYKPGDTFVSMSGKSVEVVNTDAEGRLILADAITYTCQKVKPTHLIDIATLTGGISIALGDEIIGLFSSDNILVDHLQRASASTGEDIWQLPLFPSYLALLKSDIADIKNSGERTASSITAALFLKEFVCPKTAWAHLDIAGTAWSKKNRGYITQFGTGASIRLLVNLLEGLSQKA